MNLMGSKTSARREMEKAGVPFVPGTSRGLASAEEGEQVAERIGYPVMLKAAAAAAGKGCAWCILARSCVRRWNRRRARRQRSFGDSEVYIEKAIVNPRHIEMQVLADEHGNTVWLGERECSIQRRHQKVLEEAPSPIVDPGYAPPHGRGCGESGASGQLHQCGTIEFLVDEQRTFTSWK